MKSIQATGFVIQPRLQFKNTKDKMIYQYLVEEANYIASARCEIGQAIIILTNLSKEIGWSRDVIKSSLNRLQDLNYIEMETLPQKRGMLITISHYKDLQTLTFYQKEKAKKEPKNPHEKPHEKSQEEARGNPQENESCNPCESKEEDMSEKTNPQENTHEKSQEKPNEKPHTITAFITSLNSINNNKTLKDYLESAKVKSMNLTSTDDIETFVDFALKINSFPEGTSRKILIAYFDCIRLTRQTCNISAKLLANFIEKLSKYSANQINYVLWKHCEQHDDKKEQYTLGILRNVKEPEARRGLIKLKNQKGGEQVATSIESNEELKKYDFGF